MASGSVDPLQGSRNPPLGQKFVGRLLCARPESVVVDLDDSPGSYSVVEILEATSGAFVPVAIEVQDSDRSDAGAGQCVLESAFSQANPRNAARGQKTANFLDGTAELARLFASCIVVRVLDSRRRNAFKSIKAPDRAGRIESFGREREQRQTAAPGGTTLNDISFDLLTGDLRDSVVETLQPPTAAWYGTGLSAIGERMPDQRWSSARSRAGQAGCETASAIDMPTADSDAQPAQVIGLLRLDASARYATKAENKSASDPRPICFAEMILVSISSSTEEQHR
jgi:hypothetical protein